jgi:hypothetical protein
MPRHTWRLHLTLVVGLLVCALGFVVELQRGLDGHLPAWVYVLEWPLFAVAGAAVWWRLVHDDDRTEARPDDPEQGLDEGLDAWREYVSRFESGDGADPR